MEKVNVAVLGATGAVGRTMIRILQERRFPMRSLKLLASPHSAGKVIDLGAKTGIVEEFSPAALKDVDLVFGAVENDLAEEYAPILAMMALSPILKLTRVKRMIVSTYQAVSGAGMKGMDELERQIRDPSAAPEVFPFPIAFNVIPQIGDFDENGISAEEWKRCRSAAPVCGCRCIAVIRSRSMWKLKQKLVWTPSVRPRRNVRGLCSTKHRIRHRRNAPTATRW